jgi:hypothetical protein
MARSGKIAPTCAAASRVLDGKPARESRKDRATDYGVLKIYRCVTIVAISASPTRLTRRSGCDLLDEEAAFNRSNFVVEVAQEVHSEETIDVVVAEVEHFDRTASAMSCVIVVTAAPVSNTNLPVAVPRGPVTSALMMIRSPSVSKSVSSLVIEDHGWTRRPHGDPSCEVMADLLVAIPPKERLIERLATCLAGADDARGTKRKTMRMDVIDLDQAHPLIGIPSANLRPGQALGDPSRECFGGLHRFILGQPTSLSSFNLLGHAVGIA